MACATYTLARVGHSRSFDDLYDISRCPNDSFCDGVETINTYLFAWGGKRRHLCDSVSLTDFFFFFSLSFPLKFMMSIQNLRVVLSFTKILTLIFIVLISNSALSVFFKFWFVFNFIIEPIIMICLKFSHHSFDFNF